MVNTTHGVFFCNALLFLSRNTDRAISFYINGINGDFVADESISRATAAT